MASAWGNAWGSAWGNAWGSIGTTVPTPTTGGGGGGVVFGRGSVSREQADYARPYRRKKAPYQTEIVDPLAAVREDDEEIIMLLAKAFTRIIQ